MQHRVNNLQTISGLSVWLVGLVYHAAVFAKAAQRRDVTTLLKARCIIYLVTSTPAVALLALLTNDDTELSKYILLNILQVGNALCTSAASAELCYRLPGQTMPLQGVANQLIGLASIAQVVIIAFGLWQYVTRGSQWLWIVVTIQTMVLLFVTWHASQNRPVEHESTVHPVEHDAARSRTAIRIALRRRVYAGSILMLFSVGLAATEASFQAKQVPSFHDVQYLCQSMLNLAAMIVFLQWPYTQELAPEQQPVNDQAQLDIGQSRGTQSTDSIVRNHRSAPGHADYELRSLEQSIRNASSRKGSVAARSLV